MIHKPLGLVGKKQAGKSTVAAILEQSYGYSRQSWATALKREVYEAFGSVMMGSVYPLHLLMDLGTRELLLYSPHCSQIYPPSSLNRSCSFETFLHWLEEAKNYQPWVRKVLQHYGTDYRRQYCGQNYWTNQLEITPKTVVDDCRFLNEIEKIKDQGGYIIEVRNDTMDQGALPDGHISEHEWSIYPPDYVLDNSGDKKALTLSIATMMETMEEWAQNKRLYPQAFQDNTKTIGQYSRIRDQGLWINE